MGDVMKVKGNHSDKSGRGIGRTRRQVRTCSVCGTKFSVAKETDFCPVCLLRGGLIDESKPTEPLNPSSLDSVSGDESVFLPRRFENYELIIGEDGKAIELGHGAMGVTYKAMDTNLRRLAALKVISPHYLRDEWTRERFVREARAAASLRHEHIASVYHLGFIGSTCFYAMEYVEGQTLEEVLQVRGALPEELALEITSQVAAALAVAHQSQLIHRDIKPSNLIVSFDRNNKPIVKVIDFGLVKVAAGTSDDSLASAPGVLLGTPHYASPEQFSGGQVDTRSDIYSLGVTLWQMLTNTTPFSGSPVQVAGKHLQAPLPIDRLRHLSLPVVSLVTHLLEKEPDSRPQTPDELLALVNSTMRSLGDPPVVLARQGVLEPRRPSRSLKVRSRSYSARSGDLRRLLEPWDFTPFLVEKFKGFIGREWLFQEINEWRSKDNPVALLIVGEPGIGKSAIVAALVHRNLEGQVLAYHCCRTDTPATLEPARFVRSLASMLSARLTEYTATLECASVINALRRADTDPVSAFEAAVLAPLHKIRQPEKNRYYLLIDALDESLTRAQPPTIFDVLCTRLDRLPPWLGLIATTRNDPSVLNPLRSLRVQIITAQDRRNQEDVRRFVQCRLRQTPFREKAKASSKILASLEDDLLRSSAGNFLFVRTALDAIESGRLSFDHIENLPPGLSSLYEIFFRRLFPNPAKDFGRSRAVLETVAAAREPLTREQIAAAIGLDPEEELPLILSRLASFVPASEGRYALFHKSLFDWLTGWDELQDQPFAGAYHVNPQKGSAQLADSCSAEYGRGLSQISPYCLRHLPAHLHQLRRHQLLSVVLRDFQFLQAKLEATDPSALVADYEYLPATADLRLVQLAIQLSAHVLARDYRQLGGQLIGRLLGNSAPDIQALLKGAAESKAWPWLRPLTPSLAPPGGPLIRTFEGHTSWVHAVALTADGRCAISGSGDGTLRVWDLEGNRSVRSFAGHTGPIKAVAITPDGRRVVSASSDRTLRVWDFETGRSLRTLRGHNSPVALVTITSHGYRAVSASSNGTLGVWDLQSGRSVRMLAGHKKQVNALTLTPDSQHAISASSDQTLRVWDLNSGRSVCTLAGHDHSVNAVTVAPDGRRAISASSDYTLRLWDLKSGHSMCTLAGHTGSVTAVVVTPDGHRAISGSSDHTLRIWDLDRSNLVRTLEGHTNSVTAVILLPDGRRAISESADHTLRLWDLKTGQSVCTLAGHTDWVTAAAVTPDGRRAISASADHTLRMWDLERGQSIHTLGGQSDNITRVLLGPDGRCAAVDCDCHLCRMWDSESGQLLHTFAGHTDWVTAAAVTPDGRRLVSGSADHSLRLWNLENGQSMRALVGHSALVTAVAVAPDGRRAISASADHTLRIWDLEAGRSLYSLASETELVSAVALTPDGKCAVWGASTGALLTWNSESSETVPICTGNNDWVTSVAVTPDGQCAISASVDRILRVWDLQNRRFIRTLEGHSDLVNDVVITPDGLRAVSASADHSLRVWDVESGDCITAFSGEGPMLRCTIAPDGRTIIARDKSGRGHLLRLENLD
jgi:WD40 repeat protein/serine/threonine protein kinase